MANNTSSMLPVDDDTSSRRRHLAPLRPAPLRRPLTSPSIGISTAGPLARRPKVAIACEGCRKRRSRCTGERPCCRHCAARKLQCRYPEVPTRTYAHASDVLERQSTELQARKSAYLELFGYLRSKSEEESFEILRRIRAEGSDVESMVRCLKGSDLLLQLSLVPSSEFKYVFPYKKDLPIHLSANKNVPYLTSLIYQFTIGDAQPEHSMGLHQGDSGMRSMYLAPYHAAKFVDSRTDNVTASDWTTVTSDDALVRELLGIYFTFDHSFYPVLHKDHFLDDMAACRKRYCSSLLVNVVLAQACHGLKREKRRADFWYPAGLGYKFLAEARRLWELEEPDRIKITSVQAAYLICTNYAVDSIDNVGQMYLNQGIVMAQKLGIFGALDHISDPIRRRVYGVTAWGLFGMESLISFHFYRPPSLPVPPREPLPDYPEASEYFGEVWLRYPSAQSPVPAAHGYGVRAISELRIIMGQVALRFFSQAGSSPPIALEEAFTFRERLVAWYYRLPARLSAQYIVQPSQLKIHMHYYNIILSLFDPFASMEDEAPQPLHSSGGRFASAPSPRQIVQDARDSLELLVRLFYSRHGFGLSDSTLTLWLMHVGNNARSEFSGAVARGDPQGEEAALSTLILCVKGMQEQGHNHYLHQAIFHMFKKGLPLDDASPLTRHIMDEDAMHLGEKFRADHVQSNWPVNIIGVAEDPAERQLKKVVEDLEQMAID